MRVGVYLPILSAASRDAILTYARIAESPDFDSLWTNSHIAVPVTFGPGYPYGDDHRPPCERDQQVAGRDDASLVSEPHA